MKCHKCRRRGTAFHVSPKHLINAYLARPICRMCHIKHKSMAIKKSELHNYLGFVSSVLKLALAFAVLVLVGGSAVGLLATEVGLFILSFLIAVLTIEIFGWISYFRTMRLVK